MRPTRSLPLLAAVATLIARPAAAQVMVDVNWRPVFWSSEDAARKTIIPYVKVYLLWRAETAAPRKHHRSALLRGLRPAGWRAVLQEADLSGTLERAARAAIARAEELSRL